MKKIIATTILLISQIATVNAANFSYDEAGKFSDYATLKSLKLRGLNEDKLINSILNPALLINRSVFNKVGVYPKIGDYQKILKDNCGMNFKLRNDLNITRRKNGFSDVIYKDPEIKNIKKLIDRSYSYIDTTKPLNAALIQDVNVIDGSLVVKVFELQTFIEYSGPVIENIETKSHESSATALGTLVTGALTGGLMFLSDEVRGATSGCTIESMTEEIDVDKAVPTGKIAIKRVSNKHEIKVEAFSQTIEGFTDSNGVYSLKLTDEQLMKASNNANTEIKISCITCEKNNSKLENELFSESLSKLDISIDLKSQRAQIEKRRWINLFSPPLSADQQLNLAGIGYSDLEKTNNKLLEMKERYKNSSNYYVFGKYLEDEKRSKLEGKKFSYYINLREIEERKYTKLRELEERRVAALKEIEEQKKRRERSKKIDLIGSKGIYGALPFLVEKLEASKTNLQIFGPYIDVYYYSTCQTIAAYIGNFGKNLSGSKDLIAKVSLVNAVNMAAIRQSLRYGKNTMFVYNNIWREQQEIMLMQPHRYFEANMNVCMDAGSALIDRFDF